MHKEVVMKQDKEKSSKDTSGSGAELPTPSTSSDEDEDEQPRPATSLQVPDSSVTIQNRHQSPDSARSNTTSTVEVPSSSGAALQSSSSQASSVDLQHEVNGRVLKPKPPQETDWNTALCPCLHYEANNDYLHPGVVVQRRETPSSRSNSREVDKQYSPKDTSRAELPTPSTSSDQPRPGTSLQVSGGIGKRGTAIRKKNGHQPSESTRPNTPTTAEASTSAATLRSSPSQASSVELQHGVVVEQVQEIAEGNALCPCVPEFLNFMKEAGPVDANTTTEILERRFEGGLIELAVPSNNSGVRDNHDESGESQSKIKKWLLNCCCCCFN